MNEQRQPAAAGPHDTLLDLAEVQKHAVELLAQLDRPPLSLSIRAGTLALDITWADHEAPSGVQADPAAWTPAVPVVPAVGVQTDGAGSAGADCLTSPGVGVFYHAPEPGAEPFVSVGSQILPGQQIGIIEAMKLMIPVEADRAGRVTEVLKVDGESVEYGEPLFALAAADT
jgi:acetyl-CoA carboxylase biotin carboxyl carrier protein